MHLANILYASVLITITFSDPTLSEPTKRQRSNGRNMRWNHFVNRPKRQDQQQDMELAYDTSSSNQEDDYITDDEQPQGRAEDLSEESQLELQQHGDSQEEQKYQSRNYYNVNFRGPVGAPPQQLQQVGWPHYQFPTKTSCCTGLKPKPPPSMPQPTEEPPPSPSPPVAMMPSMPMPEQPSMPPQMPQVTIPSYPTGGWQPPSNGWSPPPPPTPPPQPATGGWAPPDTSGYPTWPGIQPGPPFDNLPATGGLYPPIYPPQAEGFYPPTSGSGSGSWGGGGGGGISGGGSATGPTEGGSPSGGGAGGSASIGSGIGGSTRKQQRYFPSYYGNYGNYNHYWPQNYFSYNGYRPQQQYYAGYRNHNNHNNYNYGGYSNYGYRPYQNYAIYPFYSRSELGKSRDGGILKAGQGQNKGRSSLGGNNNNNIQNTNYPVKRNRMEQSSSPNSMDSYSYPTANEYMKHVRFMMKMERNPIRRSGHWTGNNGNNGYRGKSNNNVNLENYNGWNNSGGSRRRFNAGANNSKFNDLPLWYQNAVRAKRQQEFILNYRRMMMNAANNFSERK